MRSFIVACVATALLAVLGALALTQFQEPVSVAFTTESARV